jgi:hypothetical protein
MREAKGSEPNSIASRRRRSLLACAFLLASAPALADVAETLQMFTSGDATERAVSRTLLLGVVDALWTANRHLKEVRLEAPLFCPPDKLELKPEELVEIIKKWTDANRQKASHIDKAPLSEAALWALLDAYPCH